MAGLDSVIQPRKVPISKLYVITASELDPRVKPEDDGLEMFSHAMALAAIAAHSPAMQSAVGRYAQSKTPAVVP
jgi:hypothetical protein